MKIPAEIVFDSIQSLRNRTDNKFWGLISIIKNIDEKIISNKSYSINSPPVAELLDKLFNLDPNHPTDYNNDTLYVKFSNLWISKIEELKITNKPNILDASIFYFNNFDYGITTTLNSTTLIEQFVDECKLRENELLDIFDCEPLVTDITLADESFFDYVRTLDEKVAEQRDNKHLSLGTNWYIASRPSAFKQAPFIQTLYAGDRVKELLLLSDYNLDDLYPASSNTREIINVAIATSLDDFRSATHEAGIRLDSCLITRFIASLLAKPFVILTGLSGSGKTKLAQAFATWICDNEDQYRIVPVGADWTNREPLLGYPNALNQDEYVKPDSGVLQLLIKAIDNPTLPHFLILDEMNLSHVERYFADFLSTMESNDMISLHSVDRDLEDVPSKFYMPKNLFIIGTVNIDETTNMFSPKVLDRANTIEFRVTEIDMESFLIDIKGVDLSELRGKGSNIGASFVEIANALVKLDDAETINNALIMFFGELKKVGAEFGYRTASEIHRLVHQLGTLDPDMSDRSKIDIAIIQKLLPKLHGSRKKMCPVLETLGRFCVTGVDNILKDVFDNHDYNYDNENVLYPLSLEKIARMYRGAIDNGFTSFAEA